MAITRPITRRLSQPIAIRPGQGVVLIRPANAVLFGKRLVQHNDQPVIFGA